MSESDRFFISLRKIGKSGKDQPLRDRSEEIRKAFFTHTTMLPEEMQYDIFDFHVERHTDFEELIKALSVLVDIFNEDCDLDEDYLDSGDWIYIKEVTSDFGYELEESLLTYVMSLVMEHGGFR